MSSSLCRCVSSIFSLTSLVGRGHCTAVCHLRVVIISSSCRIYLSSPISKIKWRNYSVIRHLRVVIILPSTIFVGCHYTVVRHLRDIILLSSAFARYHYDFYFLSSLIFSSDRHGLDIDRQQRLLQALTKSNTRPCRLPSFI